MGAFGLLAHVAFMLDTRRSVAPAPRGTAEAPGLKRAPSPPARTRQAFYWLTTALAVLAFIVPGIGNLTRARHIAQDMTHLGYPPYFLTILGTWKILGAIVVAAPRLPRLKEWAYAGMIFDLTGAGISRAVTGDSASTVVVPLMLAGLVLASWSLRPPSRRLGITTSHLGRDA
ncbi:MAG TPA: DoxX family protein [Polyangia bacterium]|nr:DoxX family protein [Polyangia bacterium]